MKLIQRLVLHFRIEEYAAHFPFLIARAQSKGGCFGPPETSHMRIISRWGLMDDTSLDFE